MANNHPQVTIATTGTYPELPASRRYTVRLVNCNPPTAATVNGASVLGARTGGDSTWRCVCAS